MIASIHISQEIFAIDVLTGLESSLEQCSAIILTIWRPGFRSLCESTVIKSGLKLKYSIGLTVGLKKSAQKGLSECAVTIAANVLNIAKIIKNRKNFDDVINHTI